MNKTILILISLLILQQASFAGYGNLPRKGYVKKLKNYTLIENINDTKDQIITSECLALKTLSSDEAISNVDIQDDIYETLIKEVD